MDYDFIVVGGGVMGCATAYNLAKTGKKVLLVEQFKIKDAFNQSQDYSRFFRYIYDDVFYIKLAAKSLTLWKALERESGRKLYIRTGCLVLSDKRKENVLKDYLALKKLGHGAEILNTEDLKCRFPQFNAKYGVLDHNGGILDASKVVDTFLVLAKKYGLRVLQGTQVATIHGNTVILKNGKELTAKKIIVTAGFWINKLFKGRYQVKTTKQEIIYIKPKKQKPFEPDRFPIFFYSGKEHFYGIPAHGIGAVKIGIDSMKLGDPQNLKDSRSFQSVGMLKKLTKRYIPELAKGRIIKKKFCMYDMSPNEDFIISRPSRDIIVATGFSGHGFKFAPLIGRVLADLATKGRTKYDISRFT